MVSQDLSNDLHERLLAERERLKQEIDNIAGAGLNADLFWEAENDAVDQHPADDGSELFEREKNLAVQRTLEVSLQEVQDALARFDAGTYGVCANCGKPIAEKRLQAKPEALYCIECQAKMERRAQLEAR